MHPLNRFFGVGEKQDTGKKGQDHQEEVVQIPVDEIQPNQYQPRSTFSQERIEELAQTIRTHGMIQPIVIRKTEDDQVKYELIAGERRWRAAQYLNWGHIPAIVKNMTDTETASVALIENLQREELTVIEEALAYAQLLEMHGLTQEALAQRLGKSQSTIANKLRLLKLPEDVQAAVLNKQITERHARALIGLEEPELQEKLLKEIVEKDLNVKQTEARIDQIKNPKPKKKAKPRVKGVSKDIRIAMNTLRQSIHMVNDTGIELETDEEELDDYYQLTIKIPKKK
ncbi:chromosome partitioning protein, ParB family [Salinibacillus kushneri]|uniref:Chromosome partitioning protein, ParB family n=1 Tax=Salinibacillus kushneri TaxID=237682 RepID=A0A1I0C662_9BACI|nr:nucleoid occlusion protein [Salinibacillus kushneri]SET14968.1 chromosome partitioning protein, ParB family [Salinibacillus kushneri]